MSTGNRRSRAGRRTGRAGGRSQPGRGSGELQGLGDVLDALLQGREWRSGMELGSLAPGWADVVGQGLAAVCFPVRLERGVLTVEAASAAWGAQVRFFATEIQRRANLLLGADRVRGIRVVTRADDTPGA